MNIVYRADVADCENCGTLVLQNGLAIWNEV